MSYLLVILAFLMFIIYDYNQIMNNYKFIRPFFMIGVLIIVGVTLFAMTNFNRDFYVPQWASLVLYILSVLALVLLIHTLFFAIPFEEAYIKGSKQKLCTKGVYSICRHPGVLFLSSFYILMSLARGIFDLIYISFLIILCNLIYVTIQDRYTFPQLFEGYTKYKKNTPFILPNLKKREETQ